MIDLDHVFGTMRRGSGVSLYNTEEVDFKPFAFVLNVKKLNGKSAIELAPGFTLRRADDAEFAVIKEFIVKESGRAGALSIWETKPTDTGKQPRLPKFYPYLLLMTFRAANEFRIFAHGDDFDVDSYVTTSTLHPDHVWRRRPQGLRTTGVAFALGDGLSLRIFDQEKIAIAYLKEHQNELRALARHSGVETFTPQCERPSSPE